MTKDIAAEIEEMLRSIEDAPEEVRRIVVDIQDMFDETCADMVSTEESLVRQFILDYDVHGESALNELLHASQEKTRMWVMSSAIAYAVGDDSENFPYNFADSLKSAAQPAKREMPDDMTENVRAFNSLTTDEADSKLTRGVSVLRNELSALRMRNFSRRVESYLDREAKPTLVVE